MWEREATQGLSTERKDQNAGLRIQFLSQPGQPKISGSLLQAEEEEKALRVLGAPRPWVCPRKGFCPGQPFRHQTLADCCPDFRQESDGLGSYQPYVEAAPRYGGILAGG